MIDMPIPVRAIEGDAQGQLRAGLSQAALIVLAQEVILHLARWSERHEHAAEAAPCPAEIQSLADALVSRDPDAARRIVFHARAQGAGHESLCRDHIATAARRLGVMWEDDDVTFSDMAIAAGRILSILRELREMAPPFEPRGGRCALIATVPGELHSIGATMAADMLRNKGWDVDLRMGQSETDLARTLRGGGYPIVGLSASTPERIRALARAVVELRLVAPGVLIFVGGGLAELDPNIAVRVGADAAAGGAEPSLAAMEKLHLQLVSRQVP